MIPAPATLKMPGHHAERDQAMGFCLFNNIAIAALYALEHHKLSRVAIVDFDVHHGNGTQYIVQTDKRILYISTHQSPFYPGTAQGGYNYEALTKSVVAYLRAFV